MISYKQGSKSKAVTQNKASYLPLINKNLFNFYKHNIGFRIRNQFNNYLIHRPVNSCQISQLNFLWETPFTGQKLKKVVELFTTLLRNGKVIL